MISPSGVLSGMKQIILFAVLAGVLTGCSGSGSDLPGEDSGCQSKECWCDSYTMSEMKCEDRGLTECKCEAGR